MGRRKDDPVTQARKGYPGKRRKQVDAALAEVEAAAAALAKTHEGRDPATPPDLLLTKRFAPSLAVWNDYAGQLRRVHLLKWTDRPALLMLCVDFALWQAATERLMREGLTSRVKTVAGGYMARNNPLVGIRDTLEARIYEGFKRFGLTPVDRFSAFKDMANVARDPYDDGGLFSPAREQSKPESIVAPDDPVDQIAALDSAPPGSLTH